MSDPGTLVARLRAHAAYYASALKRSITEDVCAEAADRIEVQQHAIEALAEDVVSLGAERDAERALAATVVDGAEHLLHSLGARLAYEVSQDHLVEQASDQLSERLAAWRSRRSTPAGDSDD